MVSISAGWIIPPATEPRKSRDEFRKEREEKVRQLIADGLLHSERIRSALLAVPREDFVPPRYRDYAYDEVPLPLPGTRATISCPHSYPLFYEPLGLDAGYRFMEIGLGSGYGAAVAREVVGPTGLVVSIEIDPVTYEFGKTNLDGQDTAMCACGWATEGSAIQRTPRMIASASRLPVTRFRHRCCSNSKLEGS